ENHSVMPRNMASDNQASCAFGDTPGAYHAAAPVEYRGTLAVSDTPQQERLRQDFGLGGKLSERSRARLLNHDGPFTVRRNELSPFHPYNAYHTLLSLPVPRQLGLTAVCYVAANLFFAMLYWLGGPDALAGAATSPLARFEDC